MTITIKQIYDYYPDRDLLGGRINDKTTLRELELNERHGCPVGDTLFLSLIRELCCEEDPVDVQEARRRITVAIRELAAVRSGFNHKRPTHLATLMASHTHAIFQMRPNDRSSFSLSGTTVTITCKAAGEFTGIRPDQHAPTSLGNVFGAIEWYLQQVMADDNLIMVVPDV